jgi:hypothetical protein
LNQRTRFRKPAELDGINLAWERFRASSAVAGPAETLLNTPSGEIALPAAAHWEEVEEVMGRWRDVGITAMRRDTRERHEFPIG